MPYPKNSAIFFFGRKRLLGKSEADGLVPGASEKTIYYRELHAASTEGRAVAV
jgi:hypothetical protein